MRNIERRTPSADGPGVFEYQSNRPVACSVSPVRYLHLPTTRAGMAELADAADSKSADPCGHGGSTPPPGTKNQHPSDFVYPRIPLKLPKRKVPLHFKDHSLTSAHAACVISK
jgi:hypothetical protein